MLSHLCCFVHVPPDPFAPNCVGIPLSWMCIRAQDQRSWYGHGHSRNSVKVSSLTKFPPFCIMGLSGRWRSIAAELMSRAALACSNCPRGRSRSVVTARWSWALRWLCLGPLTPYQRLAAVESLDPLPGNPGAFPRFPTLIPQFMWDLSNRAVSESLALDCMHQQENNI